ncbi:cwf18 pre-mRNA splicing factor-domain-containing protein [Hypoxylon rubiginosum]|uniref:Cwf18 pre-mRNA splicing factor-domain-containing protein n=1 Tax=Hypoxylon rubiginosum TaxID=110542 RepID=A0ACC0DIA2_9PEZI|nr:cwf18 pre-mRNA splicing factor-domain-containing protein [Hypoxylon rubiginosum]
MSSSHATLSAAADDRKSRLAKLKNLKRKQPADEIAPPESERSASPPAAAALEQSQEPELADATTRLHLSGRNYDAETKGPKLGFEAPPTLGMEGPTLEELAAEVEADIKQKASEEAKDDKGIDLFKLQPKKPNWDLKRDLDKKLEVLNVRTDNAIAKLVRERITNAQAAAKKTAKPVENGDEANGEAAGMDGVALVEGVRVREREEEEDERREREDEELA